jgi:hypothetical protein
MLEEGCIWHVMSCHANVLLAGDVANGSMQLSSQSLWRSGMEAIDWIINHTTISHTRQDALRVAQVIADEGFIVVPHSSGATSSSNSNKALRFHDDTTFYAFVCVVSIVYLRYWQTSRHSYRERAGE